MSDVRKRHRREVDHRAWEPDRCTADHEVWPCDAIQQAEEALMWKQTAQRIGDSLTDQRDAARADADRLARQLAATHSAVHCGEQCSDLMHTEVVYALRQHEEATR